jgi:hypothetical protein
MAHFFVALCCTVHTSVAATGEEGGYERGLNVNNGERSRTLRAVPWLTKYSLKMIFAIE